MSASLSHIYKTYNEDTYPVPVLKDISLEIKDRDFLAIMGPSGSGKSTLMNIIGCLDQASKGTYVFEDQDIGSLNDNELADFRCHKIGFVFQNFELLKEETALANVELPLSFAKVPYQKRHDIASEALRRTGLEERMSFYPSQLSGGQKQRAAIARAIVNHPSLLLADEPTGALDQKTGTQIMELFRQLHEEGMSIVMITHDKRIAGYADRILYLVDGKLYEDMPTELEESE